MKQYSYIRIFSLLFFVLHLQNYRAQAEVQLVVTNVLKKMQKKTVEHDFKIVLPEPNSLYCTWLTLTVNSAL